LYNFAKAETVKYKGGYRKNRQEMQSNAIRILSLTTAIYEQFP